MTDKIAWYRSYWFITIVVCLGILLAGMVGISKLQSTLTARAEATLYSNTYVSTVPFGTPLKSISIKDFPLYVWLNFDAKVPTECQIQSTVEFRKFSKTASGEAIELFPVDNFRTEGRAIKTALNGYRRISWMVSIPPYVKTAITPGHYQVTRLARFQCGTHDSSNLTTWQVTDFDITE